MLTESQIAAALREHHGSITESARALGVKRTTLNSRVNENPLLRQVRADAQGLEPDEDRVVEVDPAELGDMSQLLRDRGIVPEEWIVEAVTVNEWGHPDDPNRQLKVRLAPRADTLRPADPSCPVIPIRAAKADRGPQLWVVCSDHHWPYVDRGLHACMLQFLREVRPARGAVLGDTLDLPTISRFADNPPFVATPQQCVQAAFEGLRDYRHAYKGTRWVKLKGNHDDRIRNEQLTRAERLHALRPADNGTPQKDPHSVRTLLHLDELGIEFEEPEGSYDRGRVQISALLGARHGKKTGPNAGLKTLENITYSTLMGHTHVKRDVWKTRWTATGVAEVLRAVEIGTMAMVAGGLGYADDPSWQQGFVTVSVWPDGEFAVDHAVYTNGSLLWRDRRWTALEAAA